MASILHSCRAGWNRAALCNPGAVAGGPSAAKLRVMFTKILVPMDGSPLAEVVLAQVSALAEKFDSEVVLLEVVHSLTELLAESVPYTPMMTTPAAAEIAVDAAQEAHEAESEHASDYLRSQRDALVTAGRRASVQVVEGTPGEAILKAASDFGCDLIAMSTHGRSGIGRALFGSVADHIVRHSTIPLLVIRPQS